tara:strand:- start:190 stop:486 length:297 start_codon:yes stop_codon:yes gene_type:complete
VLINDETWQIGANEIMILPSGDCKLTVYPWFFTFAGEYKVTRSILPPADIKVKTVARFIFECLCLCFDHFAGSFFPVPVPSTHRPATWKILTRLLVMF